MRYIELVEEPRFPLNKGVLADARDSYAALIATMSPRDFLRLTTNDENQSYEIMHKDDFAASLADYKSGQGRYNVKNYNMPWLGVEIDTGKVVAHEGRHRAALLAREGGTRFPVAIFLRDGLKINVTWREYERGSEEYVSKSQLCKGRMEAGPVVQRLYALRDDETSLIEIDNIKTQTVGGNNLKGHPDRSDFERWEHAAWRPDDMPPNLVGQFDRSVRVPTSSMKIGLVKGYNHFKR